MSARATRSCAGHRTRGHCALSAMLTVSQLSKSFAGRALFDDVSLQVNRGDRIGLVGPNGAGKSTLFSLLLGDVSPDNGTIAIVPLSGETSPSRSENKVDLPAPLGPTNPIRSPRLTWSDTSSKSARPAKDFESCETVSIAESAQCPLVRCPAQLLVARADIALS